MCLWWKWQDSNLHAPKGSDLQSDEPTSCSTLPLAENKGLTLPCLLGSARTNSKSIWFGYFAESQISNLHFVFTKTCLANKRNKPIFTYSPVTEEVGFEPTRVVNSERFYSRWFIFFVFIRSPARLGSKPWPPPNWLALPKCEAKKKHLTRRCFLSNRVEYHYSLKTISKVLFNSP